jgi:hypothetical protein
MPEDMPKDLPEVNYVPKKQQQQCRSKLILHDQLAANHFWKIKLHF